MKDFEIVFNDDFDIDELYQLEVESKGCLSSVSIKMCNKKYDVIFYDIQRLNQDCDDEFAEDIFFFEPNLIIVPEVTYDNVIKAVQALWNLNQFSELKESKAM